MQQTASYAYDVIVNVPSGVDANNLQMMVKDVDPTQLNVCPCHSSAHDQLHTTPCVLPPHPGLLSFRSAACPLLHCVTIWVCIAGHLTDSYIWQSSQLSPRSPSKSDSGDVLAELPGVSGPRLHSCAAVCQREQLNAYYSNLPEALRPLVHRPLKRQQGRHHRHHRLRWLLRAVPADRSRAAAHLPGKTAPASRHGAPRCQSCAAWCHTA